MHDRARRLLPMLMVLLGWMCTLPIQAQICTSGPHGWQPTGMQTNNPRNCVGIYACYAPQLEPVSYTTVGNCDPVAGPCTVRAQVRATFRGNHLNRTASIPYPGSPVWLTWSNSQGSLVGSCGLSGASLWDDEGDAYIEAQSFACADPDAATGTDDYTLRVRVCQGATGCTQSDISVSVPLMPTDMAEALCPAPPPPPPPWGCGEETGCNPACLGPGSGAGAGSGGSGGGNGSGAASAGGGGPGLGLPGSGPGARFFYQAGGAGHPDHPKPADWNTTLGRYWAHDYAERIVRDPDNAHVWLLTKWATFREFFDQGLDGTYETAIPSDEYRELTKTVSGWQLRELDGTVHAYDTTGRWASTTDRNGNAKTATYDVSGRLERVDFPDQRAETFAYDVGGRVESITEIGIDGVTSRTWTYTWNGDDLERIDRPDGTAWRFEYADPSHPGYLTATILVATDDTERITGRFEYDAGNVVATWRGTQDKTDPDVVDLWQLAFDDPESPATTTVTDPLGTASTYEIGRDDASTKPRVEQVSGDCPTCGLGPNSQVQFTDPAHPLRPTRMIDGRGFETLLAYGAQGQLVSRTEAVMEAEERLTEWQYDLTYPALGTRVERPSTTGNPLDLRIQDTTRDANGNPTDQIQEGFEDGVPFAYTTIRTFTAQGQVETIDPPGHGTDDLVTFVYDPARGGLVLDERIDPLVGTTDFDHDAFNRRTAVTDPNGIVVETEYDALDRTTASRRKGADPGGSEDLVTGYRHNAFGDLFQTVLPEGNVIEYGYDLAGRLVTLERKADDQVGSHTERVRYELDGYGHRVLEAHERWESGAWVEHSRTEYTYATRCHLDQVTSGDGVEQTVTEYSYDCNGNLERVWDANHPSNGQVEPPTTLYAYDALDRLVTVRQPFGGAGGGELVTSYRYDVQDHLVRVTDGEGTVTSYVYSDRDLMTEETSEVSGQTVYTYTPSGQLETRTDARGIVESRQYDALDRVTEVDFPGTDQDLGYTYDDPALDFSIGRLTALERDGQAVDYRYDRFGRITQDGQLGYAYDRNGNRIETRYPIGIVAIVTFDALDRPETLTVQRPGHVDQVLVSDAIYYPGGPVQTLELGNGLVENRAHDSRYFPDAITVTNPGAILDWDYTTDAVGNPTAIADLLVPAQSRDYDYQDVQYYLTQGEGPWGNLSWTYDRIGNRLTEERDGGALDSYVYVPNGTGQNSPKLDSISLGGGGTKSFAYGPAGHQTQVVAAGNVVDRAYDVVGRLAHQESGEAETTFLYDGRGFLRLAESREPAAAGEGVFCDGFESGDTSGWGSGGSPCTQTTRVEPVYGSEGRLHNLNRSAAPSLRHVFYFGDRPVGQLDITAGVESWLYLTTDHLGTPILASDEVGSVAWSGGFEPYGADFSGAEGSGVFLRFPGQWVDGCWGASGDDLSMTYNLFRWYQPSLGTYSRVDPAWMANLDYSYARSRPLFMIDPDGLQPIFGPGSKLGKRGDGGPKLRRMLFDGCKVKFLEGGAVVKECAAGSGLTGTRASDQGMRYQGPIPAGIYQVRPREFSGGWRSFFRSPAWGKWRAPLHPSPSTNTMGRDGFFLHGDLRGNFSTAGCVDIGDCDGWAKRWAMRQPDTPISFQVDYSMGSGVCN